MTALDAASRSVIERVGADLLHIARDTQRVEPALAQDWNVSTDGKRYTVKLRRGVQFSNGQPFTADDVVFSFQVYVDAALNSPQRDLLIIGDSPISVRKIDTYTVEFTLAQPYAAGERLFDSYMILPRHLLKKQYEDGRLRDAWNIGAPANQMAGLGPFTVGSYVPGQQITLKRNPFYWAKSACGEPLPHFDELVFAFAGSETSQVMRFQSGESDLISRISAGNFSVLERGAESRGYVLQDLGPGLEYHFLLFNLNDLSSSQNLPHVQRKQRWFRDVAFRRAIAAVVDRDAIVRLAFGGRATAIATHVTPGNPQWRNTKIGVAPRSVEDGRGILRTAGYSWRSDGTLIDREGSGVEFTILASAGNPQRVQIATILQDDLKQLGMRVKVAAIEGVSANDRVLRSFDYDAAVMALAGGDADPNAEMNVWSLRGSTHLWNLTAKNGGPAEPWEIEIDRLMQQQLTAIKKEHRKRAYDRVQELVNQYLPMICLVSPHVLVGARRALTNFRPAILTDYVLWNAEELFFRKEI